MHAYKTLIADVLGAIVAGSPSIAVADWAYTHWGMTPEQVVSATGGTVTLLSPSERTRNEADHWELAAEGTYAEGLLKLHVGFTFDTKKGGLECVMYNVMGEEVAPLQKSMVSRYGKPLHESSFASSTSMDWRTPDEIELVIGQKPLAAVVTHCVP
jgi:hypothetical protein